MFPHLLTRNLPNLVDIKHTQNKLKNFIEKPLEKKLTNNLPDIFYFSGGCVLLGVDGEVYRVKVK